MSTATAHPDTVEPFGHKALFFDTDEQYLAGATPFLRQGIEAGEACIVLTDPARQALLRENLPDDGGDVDFGDPASWYTSSPGAMLASLDRCFDDYERAGRRVRILGGVHWDGLGHLRRRAWQRYESALNPAFAGRRASLLCAYDARALDHEIVATARCTHPVIDEAGADRHSADFVDPAAFCAEFDREPLPEPGAPVETIRFDAAALAATRAFTAGHAASAGLDEDRVGDIVLAVAEVTGNVVRHAGGHGQVRTWREDRQVVFEVTDGGRGSLDPLAGWLPPEPGAAQHVGLWLARQLVDQVETRQQRGWQVRLYAETA